VDQHQPQLQPSIRDDTQAQQRRRRSALPCLGSSFASSTATRRAIIEPWMRHVEGFGTDYGIDETFRLDSVTPQHHPATGGGFLAERFLVVSPPDHHCTSYGAGSPALLQMWFRITPQLSFGVRVGFQWGGDCPLSDRSQGSLSGFPSEVVVDRLMR
jgi:hypothetical protein